MKNITLGTSIFNCVLSLLVLLSTLYYFHVDNKYKRCRLMYQETRKEAINDCYAKIGPEFINMHPKDVYKICEPMIDKAFKDIGCPRYKDL